MLIVYYILFCMYVSLCVLYILAEETPRHVPPWPVLKVEDQEKVVAAQCQGDADCPSSHVCLGGRCVRKLLRGGQCSQGKGRWISYHLKGAMVAICSCLDATLYGQKFFGGDCTVDVACGVHGRYDPKTKACACDPGYTPVHRTCQKLPAMEYKNASPCGEDEFEVANLGQEGFHPEYVAKHLQGVARCVKRPCQFDALSGRPLKHGRYVSDWGCVCDPRYGLFGVVLKGLEKRYLQSEGFDACASIFQKDPAKPINVQVITYFYVGEPISILLFENLKDGHLIPLLRGKMGRFMIRQSQWRYDYAQTFFNENPKFRARTRSVVERHLVMRGSSGVETLRKEYDYKNAFETIPCDSLYSLIVKMFSPLSLRMAYKALYAAPVCRISYNDAHAESMFRDRVVVNPQQITLTQHENLPRYNAFVLRYDATQFHRWTLDLDYAYEIDRYRAIDTNAPNYEKKVP